MTEKAIKKILKPHNLNWIEENGRLYAIAYYTTANGHVGEEKEDVTNISRLDLMAWLGY